ncbi:aldehyde dehydrogenase family protein [Rhodococcus erythropolis]
MNNTIDGMRYSTVNPANGEVIREFAPLTDEESRLILDCAQSAFESWRLVPVQDRVRILERIADLLEERGETLAHQICLEMGKLIAQARQEVELAAGIFRYYAACGESILADEEVGVAGYSRVVVRREALGVVLAVEPWNGPIYQALRAAAPNLMLGNAVVVKPSEITAGSTALLDAVLRDAGLPDGAFQTALLSRDQVSRYLADDRVRAVTLTGSDRAGSVIGEQAGRAIKPVVLELGGSDAYIVLDSADTDRAVASLNACRMFINGQVCVLPKRLIVAESVAERVIEPVVAHFAQQIIGDPFDPRTTLGPLSSVGAVDNLQALYDDAVANGATVLLAGGRIEGPGAYFKPAVLTDITPNMRLYAEEAFGPLLTVYRVPDVEAAIRLANDSPYGLGATVFTADPDEADMVSRRLDVGSVGINEWVCAPVEAPFGGTKRSGVGRELGKSGMDQFANVKTYAFA